MGKVIDCGFKKPTDPDPFSDGFTLFSVRRSSKSADSSSTATDEAASTSRGKLRKRKKTPPDAGQGD